MWLRLPTGLLLALLFLAVPAQAAEHRAVIAFLAPGPAPDRTLLDAFAQRGMAIGMTSPTVGGFKRRQMALDMSQGTRIPTRLYDGDPGALRLAGARLSGWAETVDRAADAPGDLRPGLLASTIERDGGRVGFSGGGRGFSIAPIVAANERGRVQFSSRADTLTIVDLPRWPQGLRELDRLLDGAGFVYVVAAPFGTELRLLPSAIAAPGVRGQMTSATTRRDGLVAATDVAPSVLRYLGIAVPDDMQGRPIEGEGDGDPAAVAAMADRLEVVTARRGPALLALAAALLIALLVLRRAALRVGLLAALWLPGLALLAAALEPSALVEAVLIGGGSVGLGFVTDRLVRWPCAPAIPAAAVFAAHAIDLARGSELIGKSIAGSNPAGGARFFGIGNELETLLGIAVLIGTGAAIAWRGAAGAGGGAARHAPLAFGVACATAALVMGAGRLGADVGAVITLGAGGAAAVIAALPGGPSRRAVALGIAAPAAALAVLIVVDVVTGGGAHLTRSVLDADGSGELRDVVERRFGGSFASLDKPGWAIAFALALAAVVWLAARGRRLLDQVPRPFAAGLVGTWFATVIGAAANDSGPLILIIGAAFLVLTVGYVRAGAQPVP